MFGEEKKKKKAPLSLQPLSEIVTVNPPQIIKNLKLGDWKISTEFQMSFKKCSQHSVILSFEM